MKAEAKLQARVIRVYTRQSLDDNKQVLSTATQLDECERYVSTHGADWPAWEARKVYSDVERSGDSFKREGLTALLADAAAGDVIVMWRQDRIARHMVRGSAALLDLVERGCRVFSTLEGEISMRSAAETAMTMLRGFGAQDYLEKVRGGTRDALHKRARDGHAVGPVPYGFTTEKVNPAAEKSVKRIVRVDAEAAIVLRIGREFSDGAGPMRIATGLNRDGVPSPGGKAWSASTIFKIVRSATYAGHWTSFKTTISHKGGDERAVPSDPSAMVVQHRPELAIWDDFLWERIKARVAGSAQRNGKETRAAAHLLTGVARCACGKALSIKHDGKGRTTYMCRSLARDNFCEANMRGRFKKEKLEALVVDYVREVLPKYREIVVSKIREEIASATSQQGADAVQLEAELAKLRKQRVNAEKLAIVTGDAEGTIAAEIVKLAASIRALDQQLGASTRPAVSAELQAKVEAAAVAALDGLAATVLGGGDSKTANQALRDLFPHGLRYTLAEDGTAFLDGTLGGTSVAGPVGPAGPCGPTPPLQATSVARERGRSVRMWPL